MVLSKYFTYIAWKNDLVNVNNHLAPSTVDGLIFKKSNEV